MASRYAECGDGECAINLSAKKVALECSSNERYCWIRDVNVSSIGVNFILTPPPVLQPFDRILFLVNDGSRN